MPPLNSVFLFHESPEEVYHQAFSEHADVEHEALGPVSARILAEEDASKQESYISLLVTCKKILEECIKILGFSAPERM